MDKKFKILAFSLFFILSIPALVHILNFKTINPLSGAYTKTKKQAFNLDAWNNKTFQDNTEQVLEENIGLRPQIIRLINELNFFFFKELNPKGLIVGKQNYLYEKSYWDTHAGLDFIGSIKIKKSVNKLEEFQTILNENNTKLLFVIAPDKVSHYPEFLPPEYSNHELTDSNNYLELKKHLTNSNLNIIDFNPYFKQLKDTASFPLFPKYGTHWSMFSLNCVMDTISKKVSAILDKKLSVYKVDKLNINRTPQGTDYDIGNFLNLFHQLPGPKLAYPNYSFTNKGYQPNILSIGDSFYVNIHESEISSKLFNEHDFLYYMKRVYNNNGKLINLPNDYKNYDMIIIETSITNIYQLQYNLLKQRTFQ